MKRFSANCKALEPWGNFTHHVLLPNCSPRLTDPKINEKVLDPACGTGGFLTAALEHLKANAGTVAEREAFTH